MGLLIRSVNPATIFDVLLIYHVTETESNIVFSTMGNAHSDQGEKDAWKWIKHIPVVNVAYAPIRAAVYAGKHNKQEADLSGLDLASYIVDTATCFVELTRSRKVSRVSSRKGTSPYSTFLVCGVT
jgi:hypothetical protein